LLAGSLSRLLAALLVLVRRLYIDDAAETVILRQT